MRIPFLRLTLSLLLVFAAVILCSNTLYYDVEISGLGDTALKKAFLAHSSCLQEKNRPSKSIALLKRRAEADIERLTELAHYYGYYSAQSSFVIEMAPQIRILFDVDLGPQYTLRRFELIAKDSETQNAHPNITVKLGNAITTPKILEYETTLINTLRNQGYAVATVEKREVLVDTATHEIDLVFHVNAGPIVYFGPTKIIGNSDVCDETIQKNILYKEGELFDPAKLEKTEAALEHTTLFSSVTITKEKLVDHALPIDIHVQESKHKSVAAGISYTTSWGPGVIAEWENKNLRGLGEKLTCKAEIWKRNQTALISLTKPQFHGKDQDLIWLGEYDKIQTLAFNSTSYSVSPVIQRRLFTRAEVAYGARLESLEASTFQGTHNYYLAKMPLQFKWSSANNLLDPTTGQSLNCKFTPSTQLKTPHFLYGMHNTTLTSYHSTPNNRLTLAFKLVAGNIVGAARHTIPAPDRLYAGTEIGLRGYKAYTVSPLHHHKIPIGGRSLLIGSVEARFRTQGSFGWALFYDVGNVYSTNAPKITKNQLQSVGAGIRYTTPIGPLRFDVAVPMNPRRGIDSHFQIYFSIGQSF